MMHGGDVYMHGGACSKNTTNRVSIGLQPFLAFEALYCYIYSPQRGTIAPCIPSGTFVPSPYWGKYPAVQSGGICTRIQKAIFNCMG